MNGSIGRSFRAVAWAFFGVRKASDLERDARELHPAQVIVVGIVAAAIFVGALVLLVNWVVASGVAR